MNVSTTIARAALPVASDELEHIVCCKDDDVSLCGFDVSTARWSQGDDDECIVCADLESGVCPFTGEVCP